MSRPLLQRLLRPLVYAAALVLVFEEWLWRVLAAALHRFAQWPPWRALERRLGSLGPWGSLATMALPALVLLPFKLAGMWALAHGHALLGVAVVIAAKLAGTACAAWLLDLVSANARRLAWFDALYRFVANLVARAKAWLHEQPAYRAVREAAAAARARWQRWRLGAARRSGWSRRVQRATRAWRRTR